MQCRNTLVVALTVFLAMSLSAFAQNSDPSLLASSNDTSTAVPGSAARVDFPALVEAAQPTTAGAMDERGKSEITLQWGGWFTRDSTGTSVFHRSTNASDFSGAYRYWFKPWLAAEGVFDYSRFTNQYTSSGTSSAVQSGVYGYTANVVFSTPHQGRLKPFVLAGGGVLNFRPTNNLGGTVAGNASQTRGTFDFGAGVDFFVTHNLGLRAEYRGFVYKVPNFQLSTLNADKTTLSSVPSIGIVFRF